MKTLTCIILSISLMGCGLAVRTLEFVSPNFEDLQEERKVDNGDQETVDEFQALLSEGWELFLYEGNKVVLVKQSPDGLLIKDVFGVLDDN